MFEIFQNKESDQQAETKYLVGSKERNSSWYCLEKEALKLDLISWVGLANMESTCQVRGAVHEAEGATKLRLLGRHPTFHPRVPGKPHLRDSHPGLGASNTHLASFRWP